MQRFILATLALVAVAGTANAQRPHPIRHASSR